MLTGNDRKSESERAEDRRDAGDAGMQYMLLAMAAVEIGGLVYLALAA